MSTLYVNVLLLILLISFILFIPDLQYVLNKHNEQVLSSFERFEQVVDRATALSRAQTTHFPTPSRASAEKKVQKKNSISIYKIFLIFKSQSNTNIIFVIKY